MVLLRAAVLLGIYFVIYVTVDTMMTLTMVNLARCTLLIFYMWISDCFINTSAHCEMPEE